MKSHVGMGFSVCPVCGIKHDEVVLFARSLNRKLDRMNFMGFDLCEEHKKMSKEYLALVECSNKGSFEKLSPKDAVMTGNICHIRRNKVGVIFNISVPDDLPMVYVEIGVIDKIKSMIEPKKEES